MKIVVIGDIHGDTRWKDVIKKESDGDLYVFIGDYFDCFEKRTTAEQIYNFKEILKFKKESEANVIVLIGNHDYHYFPESKQTYPGFQTQHIDITQVIREYRDHLSVCFEIDNFLFVHAGITKTWCNDYDIGTNEDVVQQINSLFKEGGVDAFGFLSTSKKGKHFFGSDMYGDNIWQSPLWVRPRSVKEDMIDNYIQIVGHTAQNSIKCNSDIIIVDTLVNKSEYLIIEDGIFKPTKI